MHSFLAYYAVSTCISHFGKPMDSGQQLHQFFAFQNAVAAGFQELVCESSISIGAASSKTSHARLELQSTSNSSEERYTNRLRKKRCEGWWVRQGEREREREEREIER